MITVGSLFDGSGTAPLAAQMCGMNPVWSSEIEKFPSDVTKRRFPNTIQYGDITKMNGAEIKPVDVIVGGSPCFVAGTLVLTDKGYVPIENIKEGDIVLSHVGKWRKVEKTGNKVSDTVVLKGNQFGIRCTDNHPFYSANIKHDYKNGHKERELTEKGEWTCANQMQGKYYAAITSIDSLPIPAIGDERIILNEQLMYVVGRWIADGWVRDGHRSGRSENQTNHAIFICANEQKTPDLYNAMEKVFANSSNIFIEKGRTANKVRVINKQFCSWIVENFGKYAVGKRLPGWVFGMSDSMKQALIDGYFDGDGYEVSNGVWKSTSVSEILSLGMRSLCETIGYSCTTYHTKRKPKCIIEGRLVNQHDTFELVIRKSATKMISDGNYHWYLCRKVNDSTPCTVYNIQVEEDHSYIANGFCVHNCQDLSIAGGRMGLSDGERSNLFFEQIRIIKEMRRKTNGVYPTYAVWENVTGAFSSNKGEDFRTVLEQFCKVKDSDAYVPRPETRGGASGETLDLSWQMTIPLRGESLTLNIGAYPKDVEESTLSQILEDNVPEKYYLSARACQGILRRSLKSGKQLPEVLKIALEKQAQ